ncbi:MAG TPA: acyltransferase family protein [Acidimicrobiia bacterium]|jgi:peptidoglycan/LPS O-acetylase OafA/YrhL|nr:acyltransferase family protein [Acidimicrobiia bacterium]
MGGVESVVELAEDAERGVASADGSYRPHLDGLRAVAVYLVVSFHTGINRLSGGFIGVDVFFVLSGFLVTQLLLRDVAARGSVHLTRFYSRRFRRLLPAAFVALIVTAFVFTAIASPLEVSATIGSFKAAFLYSANWYFIHQSQGYFGTDISTNPVVHFWSLAVEEQFYLVWPLALGGFFVLTRRVDRRNQMRAIRVAVAVGMLASALWAFSLRTTNPNRAYYGTDARAYELLAGALLALTPAFISSVKCFRRSTRIATAASVGALLILASSWIHLDAIERGIGVTITTCVILVALEATTGGVIKRALSSDPVVYLGKISYGTYLWHWLVILVMLRAFHPSPPATFAIASLVATALASLSFEMLEKPVRTSRLLDRYRRAVIVSGLAISVVAAVVLIPRIADPAKASTSATRSSATRGLTPVPKNLDLAHARPKHPSPECLGKPASACTLVKGTGPSVLLMGDSQAWMMIPLFTAIAHREDLTLSASMQGACPWQRDLYTPFKFRSCKEIKEDLYERVIPALDPDVIVVMNLDYGHAGPYPGPLEGPDSKQSRFAAMAETTRASLAALRSGGRDVLVIEPIPLPIRPNPSFDPLLCLAKSATLEDCRYEVKVLPSPLEQLYRSIAKQDPKVHALDLDRFVCPAFPICDPVVGGRIVKWDPSHLTAQFAVSLVPYVDTYLKGEGIIPIHRG